LTSVAYRLLSSAPEIRHFLRQLEDEREIAVDVEADSLYSYPEKVSLVQVSTPSSNTILDPLRGRAGMHGLGAILANSEILKVFHGGDFDIRLLKKHFDLQVHTVADTMIAAQLVGRAHVGLSSLLEQEFSLQLDKRYQRANWSRRPLPSEMLRYAALDTAYLLPLWQRLRDELQRLERLDWAQEEFQLLEEVTAGPERPPSCFDVKGAHHLLPRQRAILQSLLELREETARDWDRPPFKVLSNQVLLGWATSPPTNQREIQQTPRANRGILRRLAPQILHAVRQAQSTPLKECPHRDLPSLPPLSDEQRRRLERLKRVRRAATEQLGLSAGLVVNSATLERLARAAPGDAIQMVRTVLKRWQFQVLGPSLQRALR
jgi:ribonuclease D